MERGANRTMKVPILLDRPCWTNLIGPAGHDEHPVVAERVVARLGNRFGRHGRGILEEGGAGDKGSFQM